MGEEKPFLLWHSSSPEEARAGFSAAWVLHVGTDVQKPDFQFFPQIAKERHLRFWSLQASSYAPLGILVSPSRFRALIWCLSFLCGWLWCQNSLVFVSGHLMNHWFSPSIYYFCHMSPETTVLYLHGLSVASCQLTSALWLFLTPFHHVGDWCKFTSKTTQLYLGTWWCCVLIFWSPLTHSLVTFPGIVEVFHARRPHPASPLVLDQPRVSGNLWDVSLWDCLELSRFITGLSWLGLVAFLNPDSNQPAFYHMLASYCA